MKFFACIFILLFAFQLEAQQYNFHNFSVKDGVAQSQVYALLQDSRGYIWIGTRGGGLSRYDGINFKTFTEKDGLSNNYIYDIKEDSKHNIWIGTNNGLSRYNGKKFVNIPVINSNAHLEVREIAFDQKARVWLATNYGLYYIDRDKIIAVSPKLHIPNAITTSVLIDKKQQIWFGTGSGLYKITEKNEKFNLIKMGKYSHYMNNAITKIKEDKYGKLWIGTYGDGVYINNNNNFYRIDLQHELYKQTILDIYFDKQNNTCLATLNKGVCLYGNLSKTFSWLSEKEGLSNNHVRSIIQDNSGNYWFGTSGGGVCNYFGKQFTTYDKSSGLAGNFIYSIYKDSQKRLWVGNSQKGVSTMQQGVFTNYDAKNTFVDEKVKAITEDNFGKIYFGTDGKGVFVYNGIEFKSLPAFKNRYIRAFAKDSKGNIWVATAGSGISKITPSETDFQVQNFLESEGLLHNRVTCLHVDRKDRLWFGTENYGIGLIENDQISKKVYQQKNGLVSNIIRCFAEDRNGKMYVGTAGSGISVLPIYKPSIAIENYTLKDGLSSANIYLLTVDQKNNLIAGSETGLDLIQFNKSNKIKSIKHFSKGDGFTGIETCQNAVFQEKNGSIWFGTINGLSYYNPVNSYKNLYEPKLNFTDVKLFYESLEETAYKYFVSDWNQVSELNLPYDQNHLTFEFFAINLSNPEAVKYKWKLVGFDDHWSPISTEKSILYSNLNPGTYTFLVKSSNEDGIWNKHAKKIYIKIARPFWLTWWFITLEILFGLLLIVSIFMWQLNRTKAKVSEENKRLLLEKEYVELEQKALRLQMNPHFIFNALNSIQAQIGNGNEQEARYYLAKFSRLMRQILDNSRSTIITLQEEINTLENYLLIEQYCNGNKFDYKVSFDDDLEIDFIKIPPMLIQPFVENAIKHGMKEHDAKTKGKIEILFREENQILECIIIDNGIGRTKAEEINKNSKETYHKSTSLIVTQERLDLMHEKQSSHHLEIIDLFDEEGKATGTKVIIRIPIN